MRLCPDFSFYSCCWRNCVLSLHQAHPQQSPLWHTHLRSYRRQGAVYAISWLVQPTLLNVRNSDRPAKLVTLLLLLLARDIQVNLGPKQCDIFPAGTVSTRGHGARQGWRVMNVICGIVTDVSTFPMFDISLKWFSVKYKIQNDSGDKYHLFEVDLANAFDSLHSIADNFSGSRNPYFDPNSHSSPKGANIRHDKPPLSSISSSTRHSHKYHTRSHNSRTHASDW